MNASNRVANSGTAGKTLIAVKLHNKCCITARVIADCWQYSSENGQERIEDGCFYLCTAKEAFPGRQKRGCWVSISGSL